MKHLLSSLGCLAYCGALTILPLASHAQTWNLSTDFSLVSNPNGAWSYGEYVGNIFVKDTGTGVNTLGPYWQGPNTVINKNVNSGRFGIAQGQVSLQADGGTPVARWTAPNSGSFNISVAIGGPSSVGGAGTGNADAIYSGLTLNGTSQIGSYNGITNVLSWQFSNVGLSQGSIIDAYVLHHYGSGNTQTIFTITEVQPAAVPEPGSIALLAGMGMTVTGFLTRRRKQARQAA